MKISVKCILFLTILTVLSCGRKTTDKEATTNTDSEAVPDEHIMAEAFAVDTVQKMHEIREQKENLEKIEKKYGEQWGFCECVVANDSIDKAVKKLVDFDTPEADKLLERFEFVSNKCQAFLGMDANKTPEEREKHEKKVKKCLENISVKK